MAGCTICPVLSEQMSPARWLLWPESASPLPPSTPASQSSSPLMCLCATRTTAPCPTARPRTTSSSTSAWAGRQRAHGKGHNPQASCVSFLLSVNAGQHTGLRRFLSLEAPEGSNYCYGGEIIQLLCVCMCVIKHCGKIIIYFTSALIEEVPLINNDIKSESKR